MSVVTTHLNKLEDMYITSSNVFKSISDIFLNQKDFTLIHVAANGIVDGSSSNNFLIGQYELSTFDVDLSELLVKASIVTTDDLTKKFVNGKFIIKFIDFYTKYESSLEVKMESISFNESQNDIIFSDEIIFKAISNIEIYKKYFVGKYPKSSKYTLDGTSVTLRGGLIDILYTTDYDIEKNLLTLTTDNISFKPLFDLMTDENGDMRDTIQIKILLKNEDEESFVHAVISSGEDFLNDFSSTSNVLKLKLLEDTLENTGFELSSSNMTSTIYKLFNESIITTYKSASLYTETKNFNIKSIDVKRLTIYDGEKSYNFIDSILFETESNKIQEVDEDIGLKFNYEDFSYLSKYSELEDSKQSRCKVDLHNNKPIYIYDVLRFVSLIDVDDIDDGNYNLLMEPIEGGKNVDITDQNTGSFFYKTIDELGEYYSLPTQSFFTKLSNVKEELLSFKYNDTLDKNEIYLNKDVQIPVNIKMDTGEYTKFYLYNKLDIKVDNSLNSLIDYENYGASVIISAYVYYNNTTSYKGFKLGIKVRNSIDNFSVRYPNETIIGGFFVSKLEVIDVDSIWDVYNMPDIDIDSFISNNANDNEYYWRKLSNLNKWYKIVELNGTMDYTYPSASKQDLIYLFANKSTIFKNAEDIAINEYGIPQLGTYFLEKTSPELVTNNFILDYTTITDSDSDGSYILSSQNSFINMNVLQMVNGKRR